MPRPLITLLIIAALLGVGSALAGNLTPPGPPAPTLRPLAELFGSWDLHLFSSNGPDSCQSSRFHCFTYTHGSYDVEAVTDRETGLVWTRQRGVGGVAFYEDQREDCPLGFRPATLHELESVVDANTADGLPPGHPFDTLFVGTHDFIAATWDAESNQQWRLRVTNNSGPTATVERALGTGTGSVWCVHGPVMGPSVM
jgi:hypothetical protein